MTQKIAENSSWATEYKIKYCSNLWLDAWCYDRMVWNEKLIQSNQ
jgi:endo-alpha-1,4-polygalactosaminidase (GH114 family)